MLDKVFMDVLDMSITGTIVIAAVLLARFFLKKAPKVISYALWSVVLLRLLCPVSIEAPVSVMPEITPVEENYALTDAPISVVGAGVAAYQAVGDVLNGGIDIQHIPTTNRDALGNVEYVTADWGDVWILFGQYLWLAGMIVMACYSAVSYWKLRRQLAVKIKLRDNIYIADAISSPFVIGFMKPKIFLPTVLEETEQEYIIAHEQCHIRRFDHIIKALAFLTLTIHWFNPAVWLAFILASRDMEMSCDEAVIRKFGPEARADYANSLLALATGRRIIGAAPLAFGEGDPKGRIKNLAKWKKPVLWITAVLAVLCAVLSVCLLTDPQKDTGEPAPTENEQMESVPAESTAPQITEPEWNVDFTMGTADAMFAFVYDENNEALLKYLDNYSHFVDTSTLNYGALYVVDQKENELRQLISSGVSIVRETPNAIFCVKDGTKLIQTDYYGNRIETVYEATNGKIKSAERYLEWMCLVEQDHVVCLNLNTHQVENTYFCLAVTNAFLSSTEYVLWRTGNYRYYVIRRDSGGQGEIGRYDAARNASMTGTTAPESFFPPLPEPTVPADLELLDGIPGVVSYSKRLEDIDVTQYSPQQAAMDGCVVMVNGDVWANEDIWTTFATMMFRQESALVRVAEYTAEGEMTRIFEVQPHQSVYIYRLLKNGAVTQQAFRCFGRDADGDCAGDTYNMFWVYALTNEADWKLDKGVPYDDSTWGDDSVMIFCNLYMRYEHPPIPETLRSVEMKQDGVTLTAVWDREKLDEIHKLLSAAEGYTAWPKTIVWGPELIFTGTDGTVVNARMMTNSTMIEIDGVFYNYDPGWREKYHVEDLLNLFGITELP